MSSASNFNFDKSIKKETLEIFRKNREEIKEFRRGRQLGIYGSLPVVLSFDNHVDPDLIRTSFCMYMTKSLHSLLLDSEYMREGQDLYEVIFKVSKLNSIATKCYEEVILDHNDPKLVRSKTKDVPYYW